MRTLLGVTLGVLVLSGCGGKGANPIHLRGKITEDGKTISFDEKKQQVALMFNYQDDQMDEMEVHKLNRPAKFFSDGTYEVDLPVPGKYRITCQIYYLTPSPNAQPGKERFQGKYGTDSKIIRTVTSSSSSFDIDLAKPEG